jgi:hypothetical protein
LLGRLSEREWNDLLPQARASRLLAQLATRVNQDRHLRDVPAAVRPHLEAACAAADAHARQMRWEVGQVCRALAGLGFPAVFLKGPAYLIRGLSIARGRLHNDVDILVPRGRLDAAAQALREHGWQPSDLPAHQQWYFRRWMHELPLMTHAVRGTLLDVHHNILPAIDPLCIDPAKLFEAVQEAPGTPGAYTLSPVDMVLHGAVNLFRHGDFRNGLRDLTDLDGMLRQYGEDARFWTRFTERTAAFRLSGPVFHALRHARAAFHTPVPHAALAEICRRRPLWPPLGAMDALVTKAVLPPRLDGRNRGREMAQRVLANTPLCLWRKTILPKVQRLMGAGRACDRQTTATT